MNFANPHMLWLLLVIPPALLAFFWWSGRTRQRLLTQFIQARLLPALTIGISATRQKIRVGLPGPGRGLPDPGAGAAAMGLRLGGDEAARRWISSSPSTPRRACWRRTLRPTGWRAPSWPRSN